MLADSTATSCTSASANAACSAGTRRSSRRRRRRCSTPRRAPGWAPPRARSPAASDYTGGGNGRVHRLGRPPRRVLLHGDEHPTAGRASGHRVVTGLDLVEWQLRVAAGEALTLSQSDIELPATRSRLGSTPRIPPRLPADRRRRAGLREPQATGIRVDSGCRAGTVVGSDYDPMLAKVIAHGADRATRAGPLWIGRWPTPRARGGHQHRVPAISARRPRRHRGTARHRADRAPRRGFRRGAALRRAVRRCRGLPIGCDASPRRAPTCGRCRPGGESAAARR